MQALQGCSAPIDRVWPLLDPLVYNPAAEVLLRILAFLLISRSFEGGSDAPFTELFLCGCTAVLLLAFLSCGSAHESDEHYVFAAANLQVP
jgi:hypothetical protein